MSTVASGFLRLSEADRSEVLSIAADRSGRPAYLLEKDVWVVWCLDVLFSGDIGERLVFKGGTSLSKAYRAIDRFSEDVDLTLDIRALLPGLAAEKDPLPPSKNQAKSWIRTVRKRLPEWVKEAALPLLQARLANTDGRAMVEAAEDTIYVRYEPMTKDGHDYTPPSVRIEFGARATGEPAKRIPIACDAAEYVQVVFPTANPRVMSAERTFWEKATAAHVYCRQWRLRGARYARHWYDLAHLDTAGIAAAALENRELARAVARHKQRFFAEKDARGLIIDYDAAVSGGLSLVPEGDALEALREDYLPMLEAGLIFRDPPTFDDLMLSCRNLEDRANGGVPGVHPERGRPMS
jgi:hypothetical protein